MKRPRLSPQLKPGQPGYRWGLFKGACARRQVSTVEGCRQVGYSRVHLTLVLAERPIGADHNRVPTPEVADRLALFIGEPVAILFPEYPHLHALSLLPDRTS